MKKYRHLLILMALVLCVAVLFSSCTRRIPNADALNLDLPASNYGTGAITAAGTGGPIPDVPGVTGTIYNFYITEYADYIPTKIASSLYGADYRARVQANRAVAGVQDQINTIISDAAYWRNLSYDQIYDMIIAPEIYRCHTMESGIPCPNCGAALNIYDWISIKEEPFKTICPNCLKRFPDNDFGAYYNSGLDANGNFVRANANAALLTGGTFIDDGNGYYHAANGKTYWFVGYWLIHGQWKNNIMKAAKNLSMAYSVTGDIEYARRVGILLDRMADFFPQYDYNTQGVMYGNYLGKPGSTGFTSVGSFIYMIDNAFDVKDLVHSYDRVFEAVKTDATLVSYLDSKPRSGDKGTFAKIQKNIETNIFRFIISAKDPNDPTPGVLNRIQSNAPATQNCTQSILMVLDKEKYKANLAKSVQDVMTYIIKYDGFSNERGLLNYMRLNMGSMYDFLQNMTGDDTDLAHYYIAKNAGITIAYRFMIDMWTKDGFYPGIGDSHMFDYPTTTYANNWLAGSRNASTFLWQIYKINHDPAIPQILYIQNPSNPAGVLDLGFFDMQEINDEIATVILQNGISPVKKTTLFGQLGIGMIHRENQNSSHAMWFNLAGNYSHAHRDALSYGLYNYGINFLPDLGYPPVNYAGGWSAPESAWYSSSMTHNAVTLVDQDDKEINHKAALGIKRFFGSGTLSSTIGMEGRAVVGSSQADRMLTFADINNQDSYVVDVYRMIVGGPVKKFFHPAESTVTYSGISLSTATKPATWLAQNFKTTAVVPSQWSADFALSARAMQPANQSNLHVKYTDLSRGLTQVAGYDSFLNYGFFDVYDPTYKPALAMSYSAGKGTFVSVVEPYKTNSKIVSINRLTTQSANLAQSDYDTAVEVQLENGVKDLHVFVDYMDLYNIKGTNKLTTTVPSWNITTDAETVFVRKNGSQIVDLVMAYGTTVTIDGFTLTASSKQEYMEVKWVNGTPKLVRGNAGAVTVMG